MIKLPENDELKEALFEVPASFFFVLFYFVFIEKVQGLLHFSGLIFTPILFACIYFLIFWVFSNLATVHVLPMISFIKTLDEENTGTFLFRLPGQFIGALLATLVYLLGTKFGTHVNYSLAFTPLNPFYIGLFTGLFSQLIYFTHFFLFKKLNSGNNTRYFLLAVGLGIVFLMISYLSSITLLNPFGMLFHFLLTGNQINTSIVLTGIVIHILVPMVFITGTHYFVKNISRIIS
jgi:hypothetical protein